ncbi:hypothetical protein F5884DRAFT_39693 [Xylogone sp. PMI_703]|nr:hypothetical protein F5884DRAFT_39693 [Xylogone sp. PMI_703]
MNSSFVMFLRRRLLAIVLALVTVCILIGYHQQTARIPYVLAGHAQSEHGSTGLKENMSSQEFIAAAMTSAQEDNFDHSHIRAMCDAQQWDPSVVFTCHGIIGGIGNIRQELLHCIRYSISAGAGLILPVINLRSTSNLSDLTSGTTSMDYLFDQDRFLSRMKKACPQMPIYKDVDELEKLGSVTEVEMIYPRKLPHWPFMDAYSARPRVEQIKAPEGEISLVPFERVWQHFPICHDSVGFADTFGQLLPFRHDVHRLAAIILYELYSRYNLSIDPTVPTTKPEAHSFIGIHLRTASDILSYWIGYRDQANYYLDHIDSSHFLSSLPLIYLASGNASSIRDFSSEAQALTPPKPVVTKYDLIPDTHREELASLTWDQQALVDYLVLSRSAYFMGMADSSFAWTLAVSRRKTSEAGSCGFRQSWWKGRLFGTSFSDEFSDLIGNRRYGWESRMWP